MLQVGYQFLDPILPNEHLRSAQFAEKLSFALLGWDFSSSHYQGFDDLLTSHKSQFLQDDSVLGSFRDNKRVQVKVKYSF